MSSSTKKIFYGIIAVLAAIALWGCNQLMDSTPNTWNVTVTQAAHGEIVASPESAVAGTAVALTVSPEQGYALKAGSLKANDGTVRLSGSGAAWNFIMPNSDVAVSAEFVALPSGHHTVNIPTFANGGITASPATAAAGTTVALRVNAAVGYGLKAGSISVQDGNGEIVEVTGAGTAYSFIMPGTEATVSAVFEILGEGVYSVTVSPAENGVVNANPAQAEAGTVIVLTATPAEGYRLKAGSVKVNGGSPAGSGNIYTFAMPQAHVTVTAEFELIPDTRRNVNIPAFDYGSVAADPARAEPGTTVALTVSPAGGYVLKPGSLAVTGAGGAAVELSGSGVVYSFVMPDSDVTVAAEFEGLPEGVYSVSIGELYNGTLNADPASGAAGTTITLTAAPAAGYALKANSLKVNNGAVATSGSGPYTFSMPAGNVTVVAEFEAVSYSITIGTISNGTVAANKENAGVGTVVTLTATPAAGYALKAGSLKVNDGAVAVSASGSGHTFVMPAGNAEVSGEFEAISYKIIIGAMSNGSVAADKETATAGTTVALTVSPAAEYQLKSGFPKANGQTAAGSGAAWTFVMPQADAAVTAEFEVIGYSITFAEMTHGSIAADPASAAAGAAVTLTASPEAGYGLKAGSLTVTGQDGAAVAVTGSGTAHAFAMPQGNVTVAAEFELLPVNTYSVIVPATPNGLVEANTDSAIVGATVTLTVTPHTGYALKADSLKANNGAVALSGSGPYTFVMPAGAVTVAAEFEGVPHNVAIGALSHGGITADTVSARVGATVTLTVSPDAGYALKADSLKVNNGAVSLNGTGPYTFAMPAGDVTVTAAFEAEFDYTEDINFVNVESEINGELVPDWEGTGGSQTWTMTVDEPHGGKVYFAVQKTAAQAIAVSGTDAGKVSRAGNGTTVEKSLAGDELAVFTVDVGTMGLLFYGGDVRFTLNVSEPEKDPIAVAVTMTIKPDTSQGVTLYRVHDADRLETKNPKFFSGTSLDDLPIEPPLSVVKAQRLSRIDNIGKHDLASHEMNYNVEPEGLLDALGWINVNAEGGAEYLVRVEKDESAPKIVLNANFVDAVIRLRGYGKNQTIAYDASTLSTTMLYDPRLQRSTGNASNKLTAMLQANTGFINVGSYTGSTVPATLCAKGKDGGYFKNSVTLALEDNITISGNNVVTIYGSYKYYSLISVFPYTRLAMREGSKLTGYDCTITDYAECGVVNNSSVASQNTGGIFVMTGGTISGNTATGNVDNASKNVIRFSGALAGNVQKSGGSITGNSYNVIRNVGSLVYDMENLPSPLEEDKIFLPLAGQ